MTTKQKIPRERPRLYAMSAGLLVILVIFTLVTIPTAIEAQEVLEVQYVTRIYLTITDYYYGRQVEEHFFVVTLVREGEGYRVAGISFDGVGASFFNTRSLVNALAFPGEWHYALPPSVVEQAAKDRDAEYNGARLIYVGLDAITVPPRGMEDGVLVILSTPEGGKRVLYDDDTGILLREYFIVRGSLGQRSVVITQVHEAPPIIGDEAVSEVGVMALQAASAVITLAALGVFAMREKYRVL